MRAVDTGLPVATARIADRSRHPAAVMVTPPPAARHHGLRLEDQERIRSAGAVQPVERIHSARFRMVGSIAFSAAKSDGYADPLANWRNIALPRSLPRTLSGSAS